MLTKNILEIEQLNVCYGVSKRAVIDVSFAVPEGKSVAIIGESGSGKSTTLSAIMGILPGSAACSGSIRYNGRDLLQMGSSRRRKLLGSDIVTIFQNPERFLDPTLKVGRQMEDYLIYQNGIKRGEAGKMSQELLESLSFDNPDQVRASYPFELSGGMCQRVSIAMILGCAKARLILADEPTSALDQVIRHQTAQLIKQVQEKLNASMLLVTHDIRLADKMSDLIGVMYQGRMVEWGTREEILQDPRHRYTQILIAASPDRDTDFCSFESYREESYSDQDLQKKEISDTHWVLEKN
jgi:peptide/nickel transport system ATP-binding protein/dipeptide transport system ATP-binding protein